MVRVAYARDIWASPVGPKRAMLLTMTRLLDEAVAVAARLPEDQQDELARVLLQLTGHESPPYILTPDEEADLDASSAAEARGEFATDDDMRAIRAKYGR